MKNLTILLILFFTTISPSYSQKNITGFMGIEFRDSPERCIKKIKERFPDISYEIKNDEILFYDIDFAGITWALLSLEYFDNKLCRAQFIIIREYDLENTYQILLSKLERSYGVTFSSEGTYRYIRNNNAILSISYSKDDESSKESSVCIAYSDDRLRELKSERENSDL
ncbi:hypothetical protein [Gabonia massiliensis]|uniref:hypothetical protein n=1 Tax=Gabonia massiliensis TaxID=1686296 RepID=UPI0012B66505|nr:hypothetical protein [Gabonia massiliensis]